MNGQIEKSNAPLEVVSTAAESASLTSALGELPVYKSDDAKLHLQLRAALAATALNCQTHNYKRAWVEFRIAEIILKKIADEPASGEHKCAFPSSR
ncbi:MAG TPA: hypothetical protein VFB72_18680 [Verrucomicrobiae bacterium]|nr:hypothetical protein [Verrucomicrobiae bacterium]